MGHRRSVSDALMRLRRRLVPLSALLLLVLLVVTWVTFAPVQVGGQVAYVIVAGDSMEPGMRRGDLVIVRQAASYQVGDVVIYRHPDIGPVIHRIVAREGSRFVLQGDNNTWLDAYQPAHAEMIGKRWLHLPSAGRYLGYLRVPRTAGLITGVVGVIAMAARRDSTRRAPRRREQTMAMTRKTTLSLHGSPGQEFVTLLVAVAGGALILAGVAFSRPTERLVTDDLTYEHHATFGYAAPAPAGVYDAETVTIGQPLFRQLTKAMTVNFDYRLAADLPADLRGSYRLLLEIRDESGWQRTLELQPETAFSGSVFQASGVVELDQVQAVIDHVQAQTGIERTQYMLAVAPQVTVHGTLAGQELHDAFAPRLEFLLDPLQLQLAGQLESIDRGHAAATGQLSRARSEPNRLSLLVGELTVPAARQLSILALVLAGGALFSVLLVTLRTLGRDEATRIATRHGQRLVAVRSGGFVPSTCVVEVASFDDLVRVAEQGEGLILHETRDGEQHYVVQRADVTFRYRLEQPASAITSISEPVLR